MRRILDVFVAKKLAIQSMRKFVSRAERAFNRVARICAENLKLGLQPVVRPNGKLRKGRA